jgi:hypothetical protein
VTLSRARFRARVKFELLTARRPKGAAVGMRAQCYPRLKPLSTLLLAGGRDSAVARVEHDEAVQRVEGDAEGAERFAPEDDGRALLGTQEEVCGDAA